MVIPPGDYCFAQETDGWLSGTLKVIRPEIDGDIKTQRPATSQHMIDVSWADGA